MIHRRYNIKELRPRLRWTGPIRFGQDSPVDEERRCVCQEYLQSHPVACGTKTQATVVLTTKIRSVRQIRGYGKLGLRTIGL
jgi:hypothetical protein